MTSPSLLIGTSTVNGIVAASHADSLVALVQRLAIRGIPTRYRSIDGPKLAMQRDLLADEFLRSKATHLLLLGGDLVFEATLAERLLALGAPLVGAGYALEGPDLRRLAEFTQQFGLEAALALASPWSVRPLVGTVAVAGRRARVASVGAGCCLVARSCLETLAPGLRRYPGAIPGQDIAAFFRGLPHEPQDFALNDRLCGLWTERGGEVWIDVDVEVARISTYRFGAPFSEYLRALGTAGRPEHASHPVVSA